MGTISDACNTQGINPGRPDCTNFNEYWQGSMLRKAKAMNKIPGKKIINLLRLVSDGYKIKCLRTFIWLILDLS